MPSLDNGYRRWTGISTGIWTRRWAITRTGLHLCLQGKLLRALLALVWASTIFFMGGVLLVGQLTSADSSLINFLGDLLGEQFRTGANGVASWVMLYPEICVDGVYRTAFFMANQIFIVASFVAIALFVAKLIAHDLASQAIVIYNSKALTRFDYLIGKFGIVAIILSMIWILPIMALWLVGNLMSTDWDFFIHSFNALLRALSVSVVAVTSLSFAAMAVSALARKTSVAVSLWIMIWIISGMVSAAAHLAYPIGGYVSLSTCLGKLTWGAYRLDAVWVSATEMLPFFNMVFQGAPPELPVPDMFAIGSLGAVEPLIFIAFFVVASCVILKARVASK